MRYLIVVADDDEDITSLETAIVSQPGEYSIEILRSAELLLFHLNDPAPRAAPCLIIINNYLPDMDSLELLERVKANALMKLIPIAIMAGFVSGDLIRQYYLAGANCVYKKPFDSYEWSHMADCLLTLFCRS